MNNSSSRFESEVARDSLVQSSLTYWSSSVRPKAEPELMGWEAGCPDLTGMTRLTVSLVVMCLAVFVLWQIGW